MAVMNISPDAEIILLYLFNTRSPLERVQRAIRDACHLNDKERANAAIYDLLCNGMMIELDDGTFELTPNGYVRARAIHPDYQPRQLTTIEQHIAHMEGGTIVGMQENQAAGSLMTLSAQEPYDDDMPTLVYKNKTARPLPLADDHPLRLPPQRNHNNGTGDLHNSANKELHFLLGFQYPQYVLPVPVMHGDILGRSSAANICFRHDEFISREHCRFEVHFDERKGKYRLFVEDLSSNNGTLIDDVYLFDGLLPAFNGSRIQIGNTFLIVVQILY